MQGSHLCATETSVPCTHIGSTAQPALFAQRGPGWSAEPGSHLLACADASVLPLVSLGRSTAGGALLVRQGVTSIPVKQFVPGGSRQRPVLPSLTVSPRGAGQARRAHGRCISIQCIRLPSLTPRRPFYRERWARQCATSTCPSPGNIPAREKG